MRVRTIFRLWLPLAVSFELMMLEGPAVQAAIGRLPHAPLNLAAWGLTMSLSLLVESPVIMLLATAIALVRDGDTYRALRRFTVRLLVGCTALMALVAFTPLFRWITMSVMGQPRDIVEAAQPAMQIMLLWTAAIGWRRCHQGILVGHGYTRFVSYGTAMRLAAALTAAVALTRWGGIPGVRVGAIALMCAVIAEALATTAFAYPILRREVLPKERTRSPLTQRSILHFHMPLAATTALTLAAQPITAAGLARLSHPVDNLAAWPVVATLLLVLRGGGLALQEITVAQSGSADSQRALRKFAWLVGLATTGVTLLIASTPLLNWYMRFLVHVPDSLQSLVRTGVLVGTVLPLFTALGAWSRGIMVAAGRTGASYRGMLVNLSTHAGLLVVAVALRCPAMWAGAGAFTLAAGAEFLYLASQARPVHAALLEPVAATTREPAGRSS